MKTSVGSAESPVRIKYRIRFIGRESVQQEHPLFMRNANKKNAAERMRHSPMNRGKSS